MHEVDRNLELLKPLGIKNFERLPALMVEEEEKRKAIEKFNLPREFVVISPFSNFPLKEWSLENWLELIKRINLPVVVVGKERGEIFKDSPLEDKSHNLVRWQCICLWLARQRRWPCAQARNRRILQPLRCL